MTLFLRIIIQLSVSFLSYSVFNEHTALLAQVCQSLPMQSLFFHHPSIMCLCTGRCYLCVHCTLVGPSGLEPPTSCLSGTRSNLLSYDPSWLVKWLFTLGCVIITLVEMMGFEPMTPCLQGRCSPN